MPYNYPVVNINGTSGRDLIDQYIRGADAILDAINQLPVIHQRDYQTAGDHVWKAALEQHNRLHVALDGAYNTLIAVAENIDAQVVEREARRAALSPFRWNLGPYNLKD